jgi:hypothetical protein
LSLDIEERVPTAEISWSSHDHIRVQYASIIKHR